MRVRAKSLVHQHVVDEFDHKHLTPLREYVVIGFDDAYFRVLDDAGSPNLYPRELFDVVDSTIPSNWTRREESDGSYYVDPPECSEVGFYEDVADGKTDAIATLRRVISRMDPGLSEQLLVGHPLQRQR